MAVKYRISIYFLNFLNFVKLLNKILSILYSSNFFLIFHFIVVLKFLFNSYYRVLLKFFSFILPCLYIHVQVKLPSFCFTKLQILKYFLKSYYYFNITLNIFFFKSNLSSKYFHRFIKILGSVPKPMLDGNHYHRRNIAIVLSYYNVLLR